jgi:hypothetical protein
MINKKCLKCGSENIDEGSIGGFVFGYKSHKHPNFGVYIFPLNTVDPM